MYDLIFQICAQENQETDKNGQNDQNNQNIDIANPCPDYSNVTATDTTTQENIVQIISTETLNFDQILTNQKILSEKIDNMLQIQAITLENQQKIVHKLVQQSVQLDDISAQLAEIKQGPMVTLLKDANPVDNESFTLKPIENQRDLILLDQLLADKAEKHKLQKHLSLLCSASNGKGKTCAYKLQDILFTRDFLCNCSWAGGSRGERSKIALKDYKNVLKFFHGMIQTWDPMYTMQDNESFFKLITKNSHQRKSMKNLRMSSKRRRKNTDKFEKQQKSGNDDNENIQIQENAPYDDAKKITEGESRQIEEEKYEKENMSIDDTEGGLC